MHSITSVNMTIKGLPTIEDWGERGGGNALSIQVHWHERWVWEGNTRQPHSRTQHFWIGQYFHCWYGEYWTGFSSVVVPG